MTDQNEKLRELEDLRRRVEALEAELEGESPDASWQSAWYPAYDATTGFLLGFFAATTSLLFNIVGSVAWKNLGGHEQHPLRLIQVYLTFPLGEQALKVDSGITLAIGCCLYLATGMFYGILFQLFYSRYFPTANLGTRLLAGSGLAIVIWLVNFYCVLNWLQPAVFGGNWIVEMVPRPVAALTHLVFGWTMALLYPQGVYRPYRPESE